MRGRGRAREFDRVGDADGPWRRRRFSLAFVIGFSFPRPCFFLCSPSFFLDSGLFFSSFSSKAVSGREASTSAVVEANGVALNGSAAKNGVAVNGAAVNGAAVNGVASNGVALNGSSASAALAAVAAPIVEVDATSVMDPCEVGQLEACAQERLAERDAEEASLLAREAAQKAETRAGRGGGRGASANEASSSGSSSSSDASPPPKKANTPYSAPGGRWGRFRKYSALQRSFEIWSFAVIFFFKLWLVGRTWTYPKKRGGMTPENVSSRRATLASWLREGLVKLGPTFIKVGQQFSTRVDVLSPEFVAELEKLQDNVPPFDSKLAVATVERNLGAPVSELFEEFDPEPIAAASLGQVHLARFRGERVVVKVQRPGLKQLFDIDLKNVRLLARWLQAADPKSDGAARDWVAIYDECSRILYQEIDYTLEGRSADRFRECFAGTEWVKVPRVLWERTASEVLTMEYAPGIKVNRAAELDAAGVDRALLARRTVESYLQQLLTHGFFHADPHPGNVAADAGAGGGRLIYYDFGMMGQIPADVRGGLLELFYGVYQRDPDRCIDALFAMGVLVPGGDRTAVRRTAQFFLDSFQERLDAQRAEAAAVRFVSLCFDGGGGRSRGGEREVDAGEQQEQEESSLFSSLFLSSLPSPPNATDEKMKIKNNSSGPRRLPLGLQAGGHQGREEAKAQADPLDDRRGPAARLGRQAVPLPGHVHVRRALLHGPRRHRQVARPQVRHHRDRRALRAQPAPRGGQGRHPGLGQAAAGVWQVAGEAEPGGQEPVHEPQHHRGHLQDGPGPGARRPQAARQGAGGRARPGARRGDAARDSSGRRRVGACQRRHGLRRLCARGRGDGGVRGRRWRRGAGAGELVQGEDAGEEGGAALGGVKRRRKGEGGFEFFFFLKRERGRKKQQSFFIRFFFGTSFFVFIFLFFASCFSPRAREKEIEVVYLFHDGVRAFMCEKKETKNKKRRKEREREFKKSKLFFTFSLALVLARQRRGGRRRRPQRRGVVLVGVSRRRSRSHRRRCR